MTLGRECSLLQPTVSDVPPFTYLQYLPGPDWPLRHHILLPFPPLSMCVLNHLSRVWLFVTPWAVAHQAPLSMGFSRQEYWSGLLFPSSGDLSSLGIEPSKSQLSSWHCPAVPPWSWGIRMPRTRGGNSSAFSSHSSPQPTQQTTRTVCSPPQQKKSELRSQASCGISLGKHHILPERDARSPNRTENLRTFAGWAVNP